MSAKLLKMKRTDAVPSRGMVKVTKTTSNGTIPKGRYKSIILPSRNGTSSSNSKLPGGYLRTFGFASTHSSSQPESPNNTDGSKPQAEVLVDPSNTWSVESLPTPTTSPRPPLPAVEATYSTEKENYLVLSESQLNVLSLNLSEIADKVSPTKYDPVIEINEETLEVFTDKNVGNSSETFASNGEQLTRFNTPYSRQRRGSKSYVSKQKSFTRKRSSSGSGGYVSHQEINSNDDILVDNNNVLSFLAGNMEGLKLDSESDSGYSSSKSTSVSLGEEVEPSKRLSASTDIDADDLSFIRDDHGRKFSADSPGKSEVTSGSSLHQNTDHMEERLDSLINEVSSEIGNLSLNRQDREETVVYSQESTVTNCSEEPSLTNFMLSHNENTIPTFHEQTNVEAKLQFNFKCKPLDDSSMPSRTKNGKRPMLQRRRTTAMSFRPPKQVTVHEGESGIVEMDEAGFLQLLTDFKSLKTQLLKLKRELQEADVVSPLMHSNSGVTRRGSVSIDMETANKTPPHRKKMMQRTMTMDSAMMKERLHRTSSSSSTGGRLGSLSDITETPSEPASMPKPKSEDEEVIRNLRDELEDVKDNLTQITEERNSLMITREELEHELDSKNHTIRMLQKQLESQTDSQDEIAYLKKQVKSLTNQIQQQQQKITELRYRTTSPGASAVPMEVHKKEAVKADIRNRLRDAFVKHLGESSKSNVQLTKYIQKAEQNISMAQKDMSFQRSDSQSSVERSQGDSDGKESESDFSRYSRRAIASSRANRNNDDSGSESGKTIRSRPESPRTLQSQDESDGRASDSDSGNPRRRRVTSSLESNAEQNKRKVSEPEMVKAEGQTGDLLSVNKPPRVRKLSRSKLLNKIEASPLSHSWTPGAIEKIVKSWREAKSPSQEKTKEEEKTLKPVSHVQFL